MTDNECKGMVTPRIQIRARESDGKLCEICIISYRERQATKAFRRLSKNSYGVLRFALNRNLKMSDCQSS